MGIRVVIGGRAGFFLSHLLREAEPNGGIGPNKHERATSVGAIVIAIVGNGSFALAVSDRGMGAALLYSRFHIVEDCGFGFGFAVSCCTFECRIAIAAAENRARRQKDSARILVDSRLRMWNLLCLLCSCSSLLKSTEARYT